ncbi:MAG: peptidoglycan DD-metalloendopeptidase family protein [Gammaproteobacteria bacterium]|nr:peptidoglycan DD-metalloendopeptidase family protein [Gammaproteobacteria bacterium]
MNVIIVSKFLKTPRKLCLREPRIAALLFTAMLLLLGIGAATGYGIRAAIAGQSAQDIEALRLQIEQQQQAFEQIRSEAQRELNAMSVKLAELQAESNRINALGARLTKIARLDDGEFNFDEPPAVGGPERSSSRSQRPAAAPDGRQLGSSIDALSQQISMQTHQLILLESVLSDRELDASLLPAGMPVRTGYASSGYGRRADPFSGFGEFHRGVDFAGPRGSEIYTVADGVVQFAGRSNGYGNTVEIDHGNGYMTRYAHNDKNLVTVGDRVKAGQVIAKMGATGRATGTHLHFEVWLNGRVVNPNQYLRNARG